MITRHAKTGCRASSAQLAVRGWHHGEGVSVSRPVVLFQMRPPAIPYPCSVGIFHHALQGAFRRARAHRHPESFVPPFLHTYRRALSAASVDSLKRGCLPLTSTINHSPLMHTLAYGVHPDRKHADNWYHLANTHLVIGECYTAFSIPIPPVDTSGTRLTGVNAFERCLSPNKLFGWHISSEGCLPCIFPVSHPGALSG